MTEEPKDRLELELLKLMQKGHQGADAPPPMDSLSSDCPVLLSKVPGNLLPDNANENDRERAARAILERVSYSSNKLEVRAAGDLLGLTNLLDKSIEELFDNYRGSEKPQEYIRFSRQIRLLIAAHRWQRSIQWAKIREKRWVPYFVRELHELLENQEVLGEIAVALGIAKPPIENDAVFSSIDGVALTPPTTDLDLMPQTDQVRRRWLIPGAVSASFGRAIIAAAIASIIGLLLFPLLPRPMDLPWRVINDAVNAGLGVPLIAAPAAVLAWAVQRKRLRRPKVRWIAAAVLIPLALYISAVYIDYARATSDARQTQQQASAQPQLFLSDDFDDSLPCPVPGPAPVNNCETSGGTKRLAIEGRGTSPVRSPSNAPTFGGDFYAETRFRPMGASTWANCFVESDDMLPDGDIRPDGDPHYVLPRNFELSARSDGQPGGYTAVITRPYDMSPQSPITILAADNRPLPFIGVSSIPGWNNDAWTKLGLAREGNQYKFYVNDRLVLSYLAPERLRETIISIGTNSHNADVARCEFDYLRVWVKQ